MSIYNASNSYNGYRYQPYWCVNYLLENFYNKNINSFILEECEIEEIGEDVNIVFNNNLMDCIQLKYHTSDNVSEGLGYDSGLLKLLFRNCLDFYEKTNLISNIFYIVYSKNICIFSNEVTYIKNYYCSNNDHIIKYIINIIKKNIEKNNLKIKELSKKNKNVSHLIMKNKKNNLMIKYKDRIVNILNKLIIKHTNVNIISLRNYIIDFLKKTHNLSYENSNLLCNRLISYFDENINKRITKNEIESLINIFKWNNTKMELYGGLKIGGAIMVGYGLYTFYNFINNTTDSMNNKYIEFKNNYIEKEDNCIEKEDNCIEKEDKCIQVNYINYKDHIYLNFYILFQNHIIILFGIILLSYKINLN
jgi:hypothetical protein